MYLYRAKEIGNKDRLKETCLKIIKRGDYDEIVGILPHIRILRCGEFFDPLTQLLTDGRSDQKTAAALALGSLGDNRCVAILREAYNQAHESEQDRNRNLKTAVIEALGELATKDAVDTLVDLITKLPRQNKDLDELESVIPALGQLAQQGIEKAEKQLINLMNSGEDSIIISLSLTEVLVSYWHRPNDIPDQLFEQVAAIATNAPKEIKRAAVSSLSSLIQLGSEKARFYLSKIQDKS